ncbi:hypothetical protein [uncultured Bacteroides sp.]|uniref:hypothetical protein n=1 Tax=uncultured Bacteroides sp. TaxID=162156 RepID=UPI003513938C
MRIIEGHLKPKFGPCRLKSITSAILQEYANSIKRTAILNAPWWASSPFLGLTFGRPLKSEARKNCVLSGNLPARKPRYPQGRFILVIRYTGC